MLKITDEQNRKVLAEGRNHQMGFAFCKKISAEHYTTAQPISPCKDYLNDVVWSERFNKPIQAYGLKYEKRGIFDDYGYLAIKIVPFRNGKDYPNQKEHIEGLAKNYKNIVKVLNYVEDILKVEPSRIRKDEKSDSYLLRVPKFWIEKPYLISLYTLLVRMSQYYDGKVSPKEYLDSYNIPQDAMLWRNAKPKLEKILAGTVPDDKYTGNENGGMVHNGGIVTFQL